MPYAITTTPTVTARSTFALVVDELDDPLEDRRVGLGQHAVAEVEHVAGVAAVLGEHGRGPRRRPRPTARGTRPGRGCPAAPVPGRRARGRPTAACASRRRRRRRRPSPIRPSSSPVLTPKWMPGTPRSASRSNTVRLWGSTCRSYCAGVSAPAHESNSWNARAPAADLRGDRVGGEVGQPVEQRAEQRRVAEHQRLRPRVGPRRPALDEVAGHGERRAGEADERARRGQLVDEDAHRLEHVRACRPPARAAGGGRGRRPRRTARSTTGPVPGATSTPKPMAATGTTMSL